MRVSAHNGDASRQHGKDESHANPTPSGASPNASRVPHARLDYHEQPLKTRPHPHGHPRAGHRCL